MIKTLLFLLVVVQSSFSVMLLLPDSIETERIKVTNFDIVESLGDTVAVIVDGFVCGISKSFFEMSSVPLHQHDSLYFRKTELTDGSTDLWLDSLNVRQLMLNGASYYVPPVGEQWAMDCMLGLKNNLVYKLSGAEVLSFAGAAAALHQHDSLYFREYELANGSTDLWLDSIRTRKLRAYGISSDMDVNVGGELYVDYNADITYDLHVGDDLGVVGNFTLGTAAGYAPGVGFNYKAATPYAYFLDTDAATDAATVARLAFMCQATTNIVGMLNYSGSTLTLENKVSAGNLVLETNGGRVISDALTVGSIGASTVTSAFLYGAAAPYMYVVDTDAANNTGVAAWHSFVCAATDSVLSYFGFLSTGNSDLFLRNRCYSGSLKIGTRGNDNIVIEPDGDVTMSGDLAVTDDLTADSISGRVIKVPGDTSYSATFTLYDGTTSRGTATAYIAKDAQRRIAYVSLATKTGTITASTFTTLTFSSNVLPDPVNGATVITGPLVSNSNDIAGVLWVKDNDKIELHTINPWGYPWGYLAAGTGGVTNTDFSYRY